MLNNYRKYLKTMGLVWAGSSLLIVAAFVFLLMPQQKEKQRLIRESAEKQRIYDIALDASREETRKKLVSELESLKSKLNDYAVDYEDSVNMTLDISRIAADKQVTSFTVKTGDQMKSTSKQDMKNLRENRIDVSFNSDFRQFAYLLNILERHRPVVFVDNFKVARSTNDTYGSNRVNMGLSIFVRNRPEG
jgi:hypothetical protein